MNIHNYDPDFNELVTRDGKRYLSYNCFCCNKKHLIISSAKENARIRSAWRMVSKSYEDKLVLYCAKGKKPDYDGDGILIAITPTNQISKQDRDKIRKQIQRILDRNPYVRYMEEEIKNAEQILQERIDKMKSYGVRIEETLADLRRGLKKIKEGDPDGTE